MARKLYVASWNQMQRRRSGESRQYLIGTEDQRTIISSRSSKLPFHLLHAFCEKVLHHWPFFARIVYVAASEELKHARYSILFADYDVLITSCTLLALLRPSSTFGL